MPRIGLDLPTVVQAAIEMANNEGIEAVTIAALAQKLHIRPPSLYNHINGLPELRRQLALAGIERMLEQFSTALHGKSGEDAIRTFCSEYVSFARTHTGLYDAVQRAAAPDDTILQEASKRIVQLAVDALKDFGLEGDDVIHAVRVIRSMLHGFATLERQGGFGLPLELEHTFHLLVSTYIEGIRSIYPK